MILIDHLGLNLNSNLTNQMLENIFGLKSDLAQWIPLNLSLYICVALIYESMAHASVKEILCKIKIVASSFHTR